MIRKISIIVLTLSMLLAMMIPVHAAAIQGDVLKDGQVYTQVVPFPSNSSANKGYKVSANKSYNEIIVDGELAGYFTFNKQDNYIVITIIRDVSVNVEWHCSKYYANCALEGEGVYKLPQILQDNGKPQSFDQIWIITEIFGPA